MGIISLGIGWGIVGNAALVRLHPKFSSDDEVDHDAKENFIPWRRNIVKAGGLNRWSAACIFNTAFGHDFWTKQPTKYESGLLSVLYQSSVPNIALGERFKYDIPHNKNVSVSRVLRSLMSWVQRGYLLYAFLP